MTEVHQALLAVLDDQGEPTGVSLPLGVADRFVGGETLADQSGPGVVTFTFAAPVDLVWVLIRGGEGRADPFGGDPAEHLGVPCDDGTPNPLTVTTAVVKVWAPETATVSCWGYR